LGQGFVDPELVLFTDGAEIETNIFAGQVLNATHRLPEAQRETVMLVYVEGLSYNEAAELAYFGAKVLHPNTLRPVTAANVPVWIRNSFAPDKAGTRITAGGSSNGGGVKALTAIRDVTLINVGGPGIVGLTDALARCFTATAGTRASVLLATQSSSQNDICFIIPLDHEKQTVDALRAAFAPEIEEHTVEHITSSRNIAIVAVVGENMRGTPGVAGRIFGALGREKVNIIAIAQGSSEYNISCVVEEASMQRAVRTLHAEFCLEECAVK